MTEQEIGADKLKDRRDDFYELLLKAHENLSDEESTALNARLVLMLANQIGDFELLKKILEGATAP
jgi:DNA replication initiation complex subunit (GINS family)